MTGTAFINAVFPPIQSAKLDAESKAASSTSGLSSGGMLQARKHVLQVSTYQVSLPTQDPGSTLNN